MSTVPVQFQSEAAVPRGEGEQLSGEIFEQHVEN
jgi:hypothetical protein